MLNSAVFKRAHHAAIKVQVHCESLDDVLWFLETTHAVHRWNSSSSALSALLFLILMMSSRLKELLQICCRFYCFELLFGGGSGALCSWAQQTRTREGKKALNLGFICRPQTRCIKHFGEDKGMGRSFVSPFGEKFAFFCTNTSREKQIDKWNWHQLYHVGRNELAHARWKSRRLLAVVSLSFDIGETNRLLAGY